MWQHGAGSNEFFLYGEFADMRDDEQLWECHDPLWAWQATGEVEKDFEKPGGPYMKPDYVCLSLIGNHGALMIPNLRNNKLNVGLGEWRKH